MGYQHSHIPVLDTKAGYDRLGANYASYHTKLNARDREITEKYLPRSLRGSAVLDLGGGDGRRAKLLLSRAPARWVIVDQSTELLAAAPSWTEKICADLTQPLPLDDGLFDLILCTFVLIHLQSIEELLQEARRVVAPGGRFLLFHHLERRPFVHHDTAGDFKIMSYYHRYEDVEEALRTAGREFDVFLKDEISVLYSCFPAK